VAVKVMARELAANPEALARFRREAEVTSQLGHPHIVQVFDFGTAPGGEPYLVMEFLEGEDLEKRLARVGRLGPGAASHIVKQIASALAATHAKGIVHRDLKPANVFVLAVEGETDFVKVVDFGISKVRAATTRLTAALAVMGTPNYMAPEQAAGRVDEIDHRTDQWALGCIAYELCAGRPPFIGEDVASLLYQVIHEAAAPLSQTAPGLGPELDQVLRRSLSKGQGDRFPTMTAFAQAFEEAAARSGEASGLAPPAAAAGGATTFPGSVGEAAAHAPSASKRNRRLPVIVAAGAAAALVIGAALVMRARSGASGAVAVPAATPSAAASQNPGVLAPAPAAPSASPPPSAPAPVAEGNGAASEPSPAPAGRPRHGAKPSAASREVGAPAWPPPSLSGASRPPPPERGTTTSATPSSTPSGPPPKSKRIIRDIKRTIIETLE
jgi:serine/threonine-protein kinase